MKPSVSSVGPDARTPGAHFHGTGQPERRRGWGGRGGSAVVCASLSEARHAGAGWERGGELPTCGRFWRTELRREHDLEAISPGICFCCAQEGSGWFPHSATLKLYQHNPQGLTWFCLFNKWNPQFKNRALYLVKYETCGKKLQKSEKENTFFFITVMNLYPTFSSVLEHKKLFNVL